MERINRLRLSQFAQKVNPATEAQRILERLRGGARYGSCDGGGDCCGGYPEAVCSRGGGGGGPMPV